MKELWQLYDEQGRTLVGKGSDQDSILSKGLLHGASHVWIWRVSNGEKEILLQRRAPIKRTWPNMYDISAAGHIDLGEEPITAAVREAKEEIGLDVADNDLKLVMVERRRIIASETSTENEFCWVYILKVKELDRTKMEEDEVSALDWEKFSDFKAEVADDSQTVYVPHGTKYFNTLVSAIELEV